MNKNPQKITILLPFFLDGGVERAMINLSREMILKSLNINFVFIKNSNGPLTREIAKECKIFELKAKGPISAIINFLKYIREEKPDVIISALTPANLLAICSKYLSFIKIKVIVGVQVAISIDESTSFIRSKIRPLIYRFVFPLADKIVAVSLGIEKDLKRFGISESKIKVIYNPISSAQIDLMGDEPIDHPWFKDKEVPIILGVGRLHKQKDFPVLIEAFNLVIKKIKARLVILGEGEERLNLEYLIEKLNIQKHVDLVGFVSNPYSYMKKSSVFVLSSAWEGFGNVLAEAMSFGIPVVSTNCPWGPNEILENGKYGRLISVGDVDAMANAIIDSINNREKYSELQLIGSKRFKADIILKQYLDLIEDNK